MCKQRVLHINMIPIWIFSQLLVLLRAQPAVVSSCFASRNACIACLFNRNSQCSDDQKTACQNIDERCTSVKRQKSVVQMRYKSALLDNWSSENGCKAAFALINSTTMFFTTNSSEIACVSFNGNGGASLVHFNHLKSSPYGWYHNAALKFFKRVADINVLFVNTKNEGKRSVLKGQVLVNTYDDATIPSFLVALLRAIRVPYLAHAIHIKSRPHAILIPDWHFAGYDGFSEVIESIGNKTSLVNVNKSCVYWRGSSTGYPSSDSLIKQRGQDCGECCSLPRVQLVNRTLLMPWMDVNLTAAIGYCSAYEDYLIKNRLIYTNQKDNKSKTKNVNNEKEWVQCMGILDIDGYVNAWGLFWRLHSGSTVFRVKSIYTNYYIEQMRPYVHYIPIASNLTDLATQTKLVTSLPHHSFLATVAANAKELVSRITIESEARRVAFEIHEALHSPALETFIASALHDTCKVLGL